MRASGVALFLALAACGKVRPSGYLEDAGTRNDAAKECALPYLSAPLLLPGLGGGIDIFGGASGDGSQGWNPDDPGAFHYSPGEEQAGAVVTADDVEALFCPGTATIMAGEAGAVETAESWEDAKVGIFYDTSTRQVTDLLLQTGYLGALTATSADGATQYVFKLDGTPIHMIEGGVDTPVLIDWSETMTLYSIGDALFDALRVTFAPSVPASHCISGSCVFGIDGSEGGYLEFPPLNLTVFVQTTAGSPTQNSAPVLIMMTNSAASPPLSTVGDAGAG